MPPKGRRGHPPSVFPQLKSQGSFTPSRSDTSEGEHLLAAVLTRRFRLAGLWFASDPERGLSPDQKRIVPPIAYFLFSFRRPCLGNQRLSFAFHATVLACYSRQENCIRESGS